MLREEAEEGAEGAGAGWYRLTGLKSPCVGPCPGPAGDGLGRRSGEEAPRVEGPGGAPPGRSVEGRGLAGWPGASAGPGVEEWAEEGCPEGLQRVKEEVEGGEEEVEEGGCWS